MSENQEKTRALDKRFRPLQRRELAEVSGGFRAAGASSRRCCSAIVNRVKGEIINVI